MRTPICKTKVELEKKAQTACAFVFVNGKAHQVIIQGGVLLNLLSSWFASEGKILEVAEVPLDGLVMSEEFSDLDLEKTL